MSTDERIKLACNPSTSPEMLDHISSDPKGYVRCWVAWNPSASAEVLGRLSRDPDAGVRWMVAENHSTPFDVLIRLTSDENGSVRNQAWKTIEQRGLIGLLGEGA